MDGNYDIEITSSNPAESGYIYNANHTPFRSSDSLDNPDQEQFSKNMGFETYDNNRSTRLKELIDQYDGKLRADFIRIKYDDNTPNPLFLAGWTSII